MTALYTAARLSSLSEDKVHRIDVAGTAILLIRRKDQVLAFQAECPHAGAPLEDGAVCENRLICPWHKGTFSLDDGAVLQPPALDALKRYPVQLNGDQVLVDPTPYKSPTVQAVHDHRVFAVVGAGAAGAAAVSALRDGGFSGRLLLIDPDPRAPYDRTMLSKFVLAGKQSLDEVPAVRDDAFFERHGIERIVAKVTSVHPGHRRLALDNGQTLHVDQVLLTTGGTPVRPSIPGAELEGVYLLRGISEAAPLYQRPKPGERVVVIGNSFIGMEAASAFCEKGLEVHVVARHALPFEKQLGSVLGQWFRALHERNGVHYHPGDVERIEGQSRAEAVVLKDGTRLVADHVLIGTGIKPAASCLEGVQMADDGSVQVNERFAVSDGLWAAGDVATFMLDGQATRIEHWRVAQQQARIAARNMLGDAHTYDQVPYFWTMQHGLRIDVLGHPQYWDELIVDGDLAANEFVAFQVSEGRVVGATCCQREWASAALSHRMCKPLMIDEALALMRTAR
jgi:NADPH-dependent 2,4-dienoyl-CoA reductase/sulfur reductase-like enzyme/nitrite reductase/ring-hydroxylating ferredoxin subunit